MKLGLTSSKILQHCTDGAELGSCCGPPGTKGINNRERVSACNCRTLKFNLPILKRSFPRESATCVKNFRWYVSLFHLCFPVHPFHQ